MKHLIILILCSLFLVITGCKSKQKITEAVNSSVVESTYIHDKLTPVALPVDSSHIRAWFECDSNYNVVLKELNEIKTRNIQSAFDWHDGLLDFKFRTGGDTVYIPGRDYYWIVHNQTVKTVTITKTVKVEKPLSLTQKVTLFAGNVLIFLLIASVLYFLIRYLKKYLSKIVGI